MRSSSALRFAVGGLLWMSSPAPGPEWGLNDNGVPALGNRLAISSSALGSGRAVDPARKPASSSYSIFDLGSLGGVGNSATALNDQGYVVGWSELTPGYHDYHAFLWKDGKATDLGALGGSSLAADINHSGRVVGYSQTTPFSRVHACQWEDGVLTQLSDLGIDQNFAEAVNDRGDIAGWSWLQVEDLLRFHACRWKDGDLIDIGTLHGPYGLSQALDINDRGQIVGRSSLASGEIRPFLWEDGVMTDLGSLGGFVGSAHCINSHGQVVGGSDTPTGLHAFLWEKGVMTDLGTLGGPTSYALGINDHGQVVGTSTNEYGENRAFLWEDGIMIDLGGGNVLDASGINRWGEVSGSMLVGVDPHATFWTPDRNGNGKNAASELACAPVAGLRQLSALGALPVEFEIAEPAAAPRAVRIYDVHGRSISSWDASSGKISWNGRSHDGSLAGPGIYFLRVHSGERQYESQVVVLR